VNLDRLASLHPRVLEPQAATARTLRLTRRSWIGAAAAAATTMATGLSWLALRGRAVHYVSELGEVRLIPLADGSTAVLNTASDHEGKVTVVLFCPANIAAQVGLLRLIDVGTGASTTAAFTVTEAAATQGLTVIPSSFDFTGPDSATCGTGTADFFVFGGLAPYQAVSSDASITVTPVDATHTPGHFQVTAGNSLKCVSATVIVTDATGGRTTVDVKTEVGSAPPPPPPSAPLVVTPTALTLTCGQSGSVLVTGGSGGAISAASTDSNVTVATSGSTVTITRLLQANNPVGSVVSTVNITDGTNIVPVQVTNPASCT